MSLIGDSSAVLDHKRILPQHQSSLTLLLSKLQNPKVDSIKWLDLACGKGQIISQLDENITETLRRKIEYYGYDIHVDHTRLAERSIQNLTLKAYTFKNGDLRDFPKLIDTKIKFDFITLTNTVHELRPSSLSELLLNSILFLSEDGELFIYDMESLVSPELGAIPWTGFEVKEVTDAMFEKMGITFRAEPSIWRHSNCRGWTLTIQNKYLEYKTEEVIAKKAEVISAIDLKIDEILAKRLDNCKRTLKVLCDYGASTPEEEQSKIAALYEFWALLNSKELR